MLHYILVPGRHHTVTKFQADYLTQILSSGEAKAIDGTTLKFARNVQVVWAVTSSNHSYTRRNPLPGFRRLGMIEAVSEAERLTSQVYLITNMVPKPDFAHYVVEDIYLTSRGRTKLTPQNCAVACSTPQVIDQYEALGYAILPIELSDRATGANHTPRAWDVVEEIIASGAEWRSSAVVQDLIHPVAYDHFERYGLGDLIVETYADPLTSTGDGDITATRDYATYRAAFEAGASRKVAAFASEVKPGRILDVGCATGETLKLLSQRPELFESDLYGVEAARPLYEICEQRKAGGEFGNANIFFYQRNIMRASLFAHNSLDTIITMALTHEIYSYLGADALTAFLQCMYDMLAPGGVYINYDVAGPAAKDQLVYARFTRDDGDNPEEVFPQGLEGAELSQFLGTLSTDARFRRFVRDFRRDEGDAIEVGSEIVDSETYHVLRYADACDFLAKKDYLDSWPSEMHERFCFWNYDDWAKALMAAGFELKEASRRVQNPWLIENRFAPAGQIFKRDKSGKLVPMDQPDTNVMLVAVKPE